MLAFVPEELVHLENFVLQSNPTFFLYTYDSCCTRFVQLLLGGALALQLANSWNEIGLQLQNQPLSLHAA